MKTISLIGGMSWESSLEYYHILNYEELSLGNIQQSSRDYYKKVIKELVDDGGV